jgi:putative Holliday junction resolvase
MAFDFGDARIGIAVSDPDSILASPLTTLSTKDVQLWDQIFSLLQESEPIEIFVGRPIHLGGQESPSTETAKRFAQELEERFGLPVTLIDERLSTVSAQRQLKEAGVSTRDSKRSIDQVAAVSILNMGLEIIKGRAMRDDDV